MEGKCVGANCFFRFKDSTKDKGQNILLPKYQWVLELLKSDGINFSSEDSRLCYKCLKKYDRRRVKLATESVGSCSKNVVADPDSCTNACVPDGTDNKPAASKPSADNDLQHNSSHSAKQLPILTLQDLLYGSSSHRKCSICFKYDENGLVSLPKQAKYQLLFHHKLWCSDNSRVCQGHLIGSDLHPDVVVDLSNRSLLKDHLANRAEQIINDLLEMSHYISKCDNLPRLSFKHLTDDDSRAWTGWTLAQLGQMYNECCQHLNSPSQISEDDLVLFWAKLKTNISWPQLSSLCGIHKSKVSRTFHRVLSALSTGVVPKYLGTRHITREQAVEHNTTFTRCFYGDKVTVILDGTYIYIGKSADHELQRSSYSGQKKRNLLKFMSIVLPDGYVLDTIGPFYGTENDAKITKLILGKIEMLRTWLKESDVFIVDRGFRDVLALLESSGYETHMPSFLKGGESQHDSQVANDDRRCTKTRWIVESYHGRLKQWHMFRDQLTSNFFVPVIGDLINIVTACLNGIRGPIYKPSPERDAKDRQIAQRMQALLTVESPLAGRVKSDPSLSKRNKATWQKLDALEIDFPALDLEYLETISCGTYQIKLASGYIAEHMTIDGDYEMWVYQHSHDLIRGQIHSRHKSQIKYNVWIQYSMIDKADPIKDYYCACPAGKRTVGMCAHTASILYYLGYAVHQPSEKKLTCTKRFKSAMLT